jgi:hypothetical protein
MISEYGIGTGNEGLNQYGQRQRIGMTVWFSFSLISSLAIALGTHQLVKLLQTQNDMFLRVAGFVADIHSHCDHLREIFLRAYCVGKGKLCVECRRLHAFMNLLRI